MTSVLGPEWHISSDGINLITDNGNVKDKQKIYNSALNIDLKEICNPVLTSELSKSMTSGVVLQIQKIRNISAPKANEESQAAPRMLKFSLTDGDSYVQALELVPISSISRNKTSPGTKILVNNAKIMSGYLLLSPMNCTVLGGKVPHLVEKWEIAKSVQRNHRSNSSDDGPPPWVNFGTKIQNSTQENNFKSLGQSKDSSKENSEFELQRQGAIAEASSGATKKVFSGRVKQNIQPAKSIDSYRDKKEQSRSKGKFVQQEENCEKPQRPSEKLSLFSFLEDKLPVNDTQHIARNFTIPENSKSYNSQKGNQHYAQQKKELGIPYNNPSNQHILSQFEKPFQNKNNTLHREEQKSSENHSLYPTSEVKLNDNRFRNTQNDFNIPERLQRKQTDKFNTYGNKNRSGDNFSTSDRSQVKPTNPSQSSGKRSTTDLHYNTNQINFANEIEASDRLHQKPRESKDFNSSLSNNNQYNPSNKSYHKQNDNRNTSTSQNNYMNKHEFPHKSFEKKNIIASQTKNDEHNMRYNNSSNTNYVNPQGRNQQKFNNVNSFENTNILQNQIDDVVDNVEKMSLNSQFASRSLRQHLNLGPTKKNETSRNNEETDTKWYVGDECLAKYWEDGKFYNASITAITDKTFAVKFKGYGNIEEVLKTDCLPVVHSNKNDNYQKRRYDQNGKQHSGSMEFRRSSKNYK